MLQKLLASCIVLFLIMPLIISCSPAESPEIALVPGTVNMVAEVQVSKILNNTTLETAYKEFARANPESPQTINEMVNQVLQKTGFDLSGISTAVLFSDIESTSKNQSTYFGMIVSGTFNESTIIAKIEQETQQKLIPSDYQGLTVYAREQDGLEMVFLSQSQSVFGMPKAVRDVIDVSKKDQPALNGGIIDTLKRLGPALIVGACVPPESVLNDIDKKVPQHTSISLNSFQDIDNIGFSIDQPSLSLNVRIDAHFTNATSAQDARDTISGVISIAKGTSQDANVKTAIGNIQVSTTESWLSIRALVSPADTATLMGIIQAQK